VWGREGKEKGGGGGVEGKPRPKRRVKKGIRKDN